MKTKIFLILTIVFLASCRDDEKDIKDKPDWCGTVVDNLPSYRWQAFLYPQNSKLKRIYQVDPQYVFVYTLSEYEYDDSGRIGKVIYPTSDEGYEDYKYNTKGQLVSISLYDSNNLAQVTTFTYDESGKKIKEQLEVMFDESIYYGSSYTLFMYKNNKLVKTEYYQKDTLKYYILYEYNKSDVLVKQKLFVPGDNSYVTTEHTYAEGLLICSTTYHENDKENGFLSGTKRYYDLNGNMTLTIDNMPGLSSSIAPDGKQPAFFIRNVYEYFGN